MKVLQRLEEWKYMELYYVFMYNKTNDAHYRYTLELIIEKTMKVYGLTGLTEIIDFIQVETE